LTEEVSKLKKEMADAERQRASEKEKMEKDAKEKSKQIDKLQAELENLKSQVSVSREIIFTSANFFDCSCQLVC